MTADAKTAVDNAGAAGAASTISRDDIQNIMESMLNSFKNSLDTRFASLESQMSTVKQAAIDSQVQQEHVIDVGADEAQARAVVSDGHSHERNRKRSEDAYQDLDLVNARQNRVHFDNLISDARTNVNAIQKLIIDRLANANNNDELAVDRKWNVNETDALASALDAAVARVISSKSAS